eukprot:SAG11_NODE_392_length_9837_cov_9.732183_2_plen_189_part_00
MKNSYLWVIRPGAGALQIRTILAETAACVDAAKGTGTASELSAGQLVCLTSASSTALVVSCLLPIFNLPYGKLLLAPKKLLSAALPLSTFPPARARASSSLSAAPASALLWFLSADEMGGTDNVRASFESMQCVTLDSKHAKRCMPKAGVARWFAALVSRMLKTLCALISELRALNCELKRRLNMPIA